MADDCWAGMSTRETVREHPAPPSRATPGRRYLLVDQSGFGHWEWDDLERAEAHMCENWPGLSYRAIPRWGI